MFECVIVRSNDHGVRQRIMRIHVGICLHKTLYLRTAPTLAHNDWLYTFVCVWLLCILCSDVDCIVSRCVMSLVLIVKSEQWSAKTLTFVVFSHSCARSLEVFCTVFCQTVLTIGHCLSQVLLQKYLTMHDPIKFASMWLAMAFYTTRSSLLGFNTEAASLAPISLNH